MPSARSSYSYNLRESDERIDYEILDPAGTVICKGYSHEPVARLRKRLDKTIRRLNKDLPNWSHWGDPEELRKRRERGLFRARRGP
jgi:mRNA-degrading endonuclease RelE of RelBE toxin-antitoxin system